MMIVLHIVAYILTLAFAWLLTINELRRKKRKGDCRRYFNKRARHLVYPNNKHYISYYCRRSIFSVGGFWSRHSMQKALGQSKGY